MSASSTEKATVCALGFALPSALAWLWPDHFLPWTAFFSDWLTGFALIASVGLIGFRLHGAICCPRPSIVVAALALVPILQWLGGQIFFFGDALVAFLYLFGFSLSIAVGRNLRSAGLWTAEPVVWAVVVCALASTALALCQWLSIDLPGGWIVRSGRDHRPFANFAQPNQFATFQAIGCLLAAWLHERRRLGLLCLVCVDLFLLMGVALSRSRSALVEIAVVVLWLYLRRARPVRRRYRIAWFWGLVMFGLFVIGQSVVEDLLKLTPTRSASEQLSAGSRPIHWATALDAIGRSPWYGYGWNQAAVGIGRAAVDHAPSGWFIEHAHNLVLDLLLWNGVPLGGLVIFLILRWLGDVGKSVACDADALLYAVVLSVGVHSLFEFPLEYAYMLLPVGFFVGFLEFVRRPSDDLPSISKSATVFLAAAGCVVLTMVGRDYLRIEDNLRAVRLNAAFIRRGVELPHPDALLLTQLQSYLAFASTPPTRNMTPTAFTSMRQVAERFGYAPVLFRFALASALNGKAEAATTSLARICKQQSARQCDDAKESWQDLQRSDQYPETHALPFPNVEPRR